MSDFRNTVALCLPWPDSDLSPNHRGAWQTKEAARKQAVKDGGYAVIASRDAGCFDGLKGVNVSAGHWPPKEEPSEKTGEMI